MSPSRPPTGRAVRPLTAAPVALLVALVLALVAGCGLRLETPPPAPLVPDVEEEARQRASADAVALQVLAGAPVAADPADPVAVARAAVAAAAAVHGDLLGGLYDPDGDRDPGPGGGPGTDDAADDAPSGPDGDAAATDAATPAATPEPEPTVATTDAVLARLVEAAATARTDTAAVADGALARLLGSIAVHRELSAARLAAAAGLPGPPPPTAAVPATRPEGLSDGDLSALVVAEDAAGYALEVIAAKAGGETRRRAAESALRHRSHAQAWAEAGGLAGTGLDPRRVAYALPGGLEDPAAAAALVQTLETTLAADYASVVASVVPEARSTALDALAEATAQAVAWGAALPTLPGLPERAGT